MRGVITALMPAAAAALLAAPAARADHESGPARASLALPGAVNLIVRDQPAFTFPFALQGVTVSDPADGATMGAGRSAAVTGTARVLTGRVPPDAAEVQVRDPAGALLGTVEAPVECVDNCEAGPAGRRAFRLGPATIPASLLPPPDRRDRRRFVLRLTVGNNPSLGQSTTFADGVDVGFGSPEPTANAYAQALEVTQAIQDQVVRATATRGIASMNADYPTSVPLITGKPTAVRLLPNVENGLRAGGSQPALGNVTGLLHAFRGNAELPDSPIEPVRLATVEPFAAPPDLKGLRDRFDVPGRELAWRIPDSWATGTLRLKATVNDEGLRETRRFRECLGCSDGANSIVTTVRFTPSVSTLKFDPFLVEYDPPGAAAPVRPAATVPAELEYLKRTYPIDPDAVSVGSTVGIVRTGSRECSDLLNAVVFAALASPRNGLPIGILPSHPDMCRVSNSPLTADDDFAATGLGSAAGAVWESFANAAMTAPHEIGHLLGRPHASCDHGEAADGAGGCDAAFRPRHAQLGGHGYGVANMGTYPEQIDAETHLHDVMSYGGLKWISTTTYTALLAELLRRQNGSGVVASVPGGGPGARAVAAKEASASSLLLGRTAAAPRDALVVTATVGPGTAATIGRAARLAVSPVRLGTRGTHALRALDAAGRTVAVHRFDLDPTAIHGPPITVTGATFPSPARIATLVRERGGTVLARWQASRAAPAVQWTDPPRQAPLRARGQRRVSWSASDADGDGLSYVVQFSRDGGRTWRTLDPQVPGLSYDVDLARLPATRRGRFRVIATDGLRSATDVAGAAVQVPNHPPQAAITSPRDGAAATAGTALALTGTAADVDDDGAVPGLRWRSSRDGVLGSGPALLARLSPGAHALTLEARDGSGARGSARLGVTVARAPGTSDRVRPRLVRARRAGPSAVALTFSEDVAGLGSRAIAVPGAGPAVQVDYAPRSRTATVRFARRVTAARVAVRAPLADAAGNAIAPASARLGR